MELTVRDILELNAAVTQVEGYYKLVSKEKDGKTEEVPVFIPNKFSGKARWNLSKALTLTKRVRDEFNGIKDAIIKEVSNGGDRIEETDTEKIKLFNTKINQALDQKETLPLVTIKLSDLNLDENNIPATVLSALSVIIEDDAA